MMSRFVGFLAFASLATCSILSTPAMAQIGNPGGMAPGTAEVKPGVPGPDQTNTVDQLFARLAAIGGKSEVDLGTLARRKTTSDAVKQFADRMVDDHSKANVKLEALAKKAGIALPTAPDAEHKGTRERLDQVSGRQFDLDYLNAQIADHQKTAQLLAWEIDSGEDAHIQHFASETLPIVLDHLQMARSVKMELIGEAASTDRRRNQSP
jgi:putative membrane protein